MKKTTIKKAGLVALGLLLCIIPAALSAQPGTVSTEAVPIEQPLVREGQFATRLDAALGLGVTGDEITAENALGGVGIAPRNGWIADYPVTPDILSELRNSVALSVDNGWLALPGDEALRRFDTVAAEFGLTITPYTASGGYEAGQEDGYAYPDTAIINNYYYEDGPPIVTYFTPPPDYYYLYSWVPFPFWCSGVRFGGFFVLRDFHRPFFFDHHEAFISNHFYDRHMHRAFRIDPAARFHGNSFTGIGAVHAVTHPAGVAGNTGRFVNPPRTGSGFEGRVNGGGTVPSATGIAGRTITGGNAAGGASGSAVMSSGERNFNGHGARSRWYGLPPSSAVSGIRPSLPSSGAGSFSRNFRAGRSYTPPSAGSGFHGSPAFSGRSFAMPRMTGRAYAMPQESRGSFRYQGGSRSYGVLPSIARVPSTPFSSVRPALPSSTSGSLAHNSWGGRSFTPPSAGSGFHGSPAFSGRSFASPAMGGRSFSMPSVGGFAGRGHR